MNVAATVQWPAGCGAQSARTSDRGSEMLRPLDVQCRYSPRAEYEGADRAGEHRAEEDRELGNASGRGLARSADGR